MARPVGGKKLFSCTLHILVNSSEAPLPILSEQALSGFLRKEALQQIAALVDPQGRWQPKHSVCSWLNSLVKAFRHGPRRVLAAMIWLGLEPEVASLNFRFQPSHFSASGSRWLQRPECGGLDWPLKRGNPPSKV